MTEISKPRQPVYDAGLFISDLPSSDWIKFVDKLLVEIRDIKQAALNLTDLVITNRAFINDNDVYGASVYLRSLVVPEEISDEGGRTDEPRP